MKQRVSLITLGVADTAKARAFYEQLGWRGKSPDGDVVFYDAGGTIFSIWGRDDLAKDSEIANDAGGKLSCELTDKFNLTIGVPALNQLLRGTPDVRPQIGDRSSRKAPGER